MLRISVLSVHGQPPDKPQSAEFGAEGGSIGREEGVTLALDDPGRHLSRVQAYIKCLGGEYFLVDHGGNPSRVNARELGKGKVVGLHHGDHISMADWELLVECEHSAEKFRVSPALVSAGSDGPPEATQLLDEQAFDFQLASESGLATGPAAPVQLLEAFMRGLGVQGMFLPADLDPQQAERMGLELRQLLSESGMVEPEAVKTQLGAVLQSPVEGRSAMLAGG